MYCRLSILTFASSALLAAAGVVPLSIVSERAAASADEWYFDVYEQGGCPKNPSESFADYAYHAAEGCQNFGFKVSSATFSNGNGKWKAIAYQEENCEGYDNDGQSEEFTNNPGSCYGSAVFLKGPSYLQSFKVVAT